MMPRVTPAVTAQVPGVVEPVTPRLRRRALPSLHEHKRRVEWGRKYGPLVGGSIRLYIAQHGG